MTTLTVKIDNKAINFIATKHSNINSYLSKLIKEDMLLTEINESKSSWINNLEFLDDLDK